MCVKCKNLHLTATMIHYNVLQLACFIFLRSQNLPLNDGLNGHIAQMHAVYTMLAYHSYDHVPYNMLDLLETTIKVYYSPQDATCI